MKIVIAGYNTCCFNKSGGVQVRIKKIYELLSKQNDIEVEFFRPMETDINTVDILHIFKLEPEFWNLIERAKIIGVKVVLSSIVSVSRGSIIDIYRLMNNIVPIKNIYKINERIMNLVDYIIAETQMEANFIIRHYRVPEEKIEVIANGVDPDYYDGNEIFKRLGDKKEYVLQVGVIDYNKNQLNAIKALKETNIDFVIIGGPYNPASSYLETCKKVASESPNIHFLGWQSANSPLLKSAYAHAKVLLFPSYHETFGLVAIEGAMYGCNIAISKTLPIHGFHVFDDCWLFNPGDVNDIREKVLSAYNSPKTEETKKKVLETFSWKKIIEKYVDIYKSLLFKNDNKNN